MHNEDSISSFRNQLSRFREIAESLKLDSDTGAKPSDALSFAEWLMLCPSESSAIAHMQRDQKGAIAFLEIARILDEEFATRNAKPLNAPHPDQTPYYIVSSGVVEWLNSRKDYFPDMWQ